MTTSKSAGGAARIIDGVKTFGEGGAAVRALDGVSAEFEAGPIQRHYGTVRIR